MEMEIEIEDAELEDVKVKLLDCVVQNEWEQVVAICKQCPIAYKVIIPESGGTILCMAVSVKKEEIVEQLVRQISEPELDALKIKNEEGDTPLHLAASIGNVQMCKCITDKDPILVGIPNIKGETPLFLAALHGKKEAFLFLHERCESSQRYHYSRRADGRTILHCAIDGGYFDLALEIIDRYEDLAHRVDEMELSPLHLLASTPTAFRSGARLNWIERMMYHGLDAEDLQSPESSKTKKPFQCPENYQTCMEFGKKIKTAATIVFGPDCQKDGDAENPQAQRMYPPNYDICFKFIKLAYMAMLVFLGFGFAKLMKIKNMKKKHSKAVQLLNKLLEIQPRQGYSSISDTNQNVKEESSSVNCEASSCICSSETTSKNKEEKRNFKELWKTHTPILIAAMNGVTEMVNKILQVNPVAINDRNGENKNIVLLAVENRQPEVYDLLLNREFRKDSVFLAVDNEGNNALHLAAKLSNYEPWHIPGAALQMQWEIMWYKYVKSSMQRHFFIHYNKFGYTPKEIFTKDHSDLLKSGGKWLNSTSTSCSVVAALIATVAFATSATVPGSFNGNGKPVLVQKSAFSIFAVSSLTALCFSVTSLVMFLAILTSRHQEDDFHMELPRKLLFGLTTLFISIAAMLVCFCAGHFFVLSEELKYAAVPVYVVTCLPISLFAVVQFPLYFDLVQATFRKVPQRSYKVVF